MDSLGLFAALAFLLALYVALPVLFLWKTVYAASTGRRLLWLVALLANLGACYIIGVCLLAFFEGAGSAFSSENI